MLNMQDLSSLPSELFCSHKSNPKYKQTHRQWLANFGNIPSFSKCRESSNIPLLLGKECSSGQQTPNHSRCAHSSCCCSYKALTGKIPPNLYPPCFWMCQEVQYHSPDWPGSKIPKPVLSIF